LGIIKAIVGFFISTIVSIATGYFGFKFREIASGLLGGIGGFLLGFLLYSLILAMFIKSSTILLCIILVASSAVGTFLI
jgi:hypothetical protein